MRARITAGLRRARGAVLVLALTGAALACATAQAVDIETAEIEYDDGNVSYTFSAVLDGPHHQVWALVTDYNRLTRLNTNILTSRVLERYENGDSKRLLRVRRCILKICFKLRFVERLVEKSDTILATVVPGEGNFLNGRAEWRVAAVDAQHTRLSIKARQAPDFWIPPVIGPLILRQVFVKELEDTCLNIERLVAAVAGKT